MAESRTVEQTTLFGVAPKKSKEEIERDAAAAVVAWRNETRARLIELARDMLDSDFEKYGEDAPGITFDEVRFRAETRGWLSGKEVGRLLSFGADVMRKAGGYSVGYRASRHPNSKARPVRLWKKRVAVPIGEVTG